MSLGLTSKWSRPVAAVTIAGTSLLVAAAVGSVFLRIALDAWTAVVAAGPAAPDDGILLVTGLGGGLLSLWLGLGVALSALSALPGALGRLCRYSAGRVAPAAVRKVVTFVLGTTLAAAMIPGTAVAGASHEALRGSVVATTLRGAHITSGLPAAGAGQEAPRGSVVATTLARAHLTSGLAAAVPDASFRLVGERPPVSQVAEVPDNGDASDAAPPPSWAPERSATRVGPAVRLRPALVTGHPTVADAVVVLRGDTLWSIAAHHLGPSASAADVDAAWHRWLTTNRDVIGEDADLILPGQVLRAPSSGAGS